MENTYYVEYEEERRLSKQKYWEDDNGAALKLEGSRDQRTLLVNIQRLIQVIAYNAYMDPESTRFETNALTKTEEKIASRVGANYQKLVVEFVRGVAYFDGFAAFQEEVLMPLLLTHKRTQYSIAALLSKSAKKETGFEEISGKSIVENAKKAIRGFAPLEKKFHKLLGPSGSPPSGMQWSDLLAGFRRMLYLEREKSGKKADPVVEDVDEEGGESGDELADGKETRLAALLDNINESVPVGWLPNMEYSSAWLVFVYFGPYGRQIFGSAPLYVLSNLNAQPIDTVKYGRSETRSRKPHQEVNSVFDKILANDAKREEREARKEMLDHLRRKLEREEKRIWSEHAMIQEEADSLRKQLDETRESIERQSILIMTYKTLLNDSKIELDFREGLLKKIQKLTEKTSNGEEALSTLEEQYREVRTKASESKRRCHDRVEALHKEYEREETVAAAAFSDGKRLKHLSSGVLHGDGNDRDDSEDEVSTYAV